MACVALVALLLLVIATILRLFVLFVQLVTPRYALMISLLAFTLWFVDSRRRRYAKGFYSCARVPHAPTSLELNDPRGKQEEEEEEEERQFTPTLTAVPWMTSQVDECNKVASAVLSETESEDDESDGGGRKALSGSKPLLVTTSLSSSSKSCLDMSMRRNNPTERVGPTRPRSSSATGIRPQLPTTRSMVHRSNTDRTERHDQVPRRRQDTRGTNNSEQVECARRASFKDVRIPSSRSSLDRLDEALRSDGYWIGDFQLVSRRGQSPPKPV
ncbi:hypothetical protein PsorP6_015714 [Peronosclerospora sorghi]|uniref:Uncharacterized protein n=1 Tax=Peronosclerospora sorghi TaxID=230839 RepID=A0ACC0WQK2_9STRA|nr:hypothetical protein PsorP6_015714 [Peronosclerospora sorghi]